MNKIFQFTFTIVTVLFLNVSSSIAQQQETSLKYGKYGCTASKYNGSYYETIPKGYFTIAANGTYIYYGFKKPSTGKFSIDSKGNLLFKGGYFDGGKAEKIDRPNKFFITFPSNPDNRWTAGFVDK